MKRPISSRSNRRSCPRHSSAPSTARGTSTSSRSRPRQATSSFSRHGPGPWLATAAVATLLDQRGHTLVEVNEAGAPVDPVLMHTARTSGPCSSRSRDADYGGSGTHFYRIAAGRHAAVRSVFPLGVQTGRAAMIDVVGSNLNGLKQVSIPAAVDGRGPHARGCAGRGQPGQQQDRRGGRWPAD